MAKSFHSSNTTANDMKKKILKTKAENILASANKRTQEGIDQVLMLEERATEIAAFNSGDIDNFVDSVFNSESLSIFKGGKATTPLGFASDKSITRPILDSLYKNNFFNNLATLSDLKKNQSGQELTDKTVIASSKLMEGTINYNYASKLGITDIQSTYKGTQLLRNIKKDGGHIIDFDIESLGGINSKGHQQLDYITEISATAFEVIPNAETKIAEEMNTVFGFSKEEADSVELYLNKLKSKPKNKLTGQDQVNLNRLSRSADPNIKYDMSNGFDIKITDTTNAISEKDLKANVDDAIKGVKKLREFGVHQEKFLESQGLNKAGDYVKYKKNYVKDVQEFVFNGVGKQGTYKDALVTGHNIVNFDGPQMATYSGHQIAAPKNRTLDTLNAVKAIEEYVGEGTFHNNVPLDKISSASKLHGTGTQDYFKEIYNIGTGKTGKAQAHNARIDVQNHFNLLMNSQFGVELDNNMTLVNNKMQGLKGGYQQEGRVGVFYSPKTSTVGYGNKNNALSFAYNPLDDTFMSYGGDKINKSTGEVTHGEFNGWGPKSNALYEKRVYDVNLSEDWRNIFKQAGMDDKSSEAFYQQYAGLTNVQIIESREFVDKKKLAEKVGKDGVETFTHGGGLVHYQIVTNPEQLATELALKVGYKNEDGSFSPKKESIEALRLQKMEQLEDGSIAVKMLTADEAVDAMVDRSTFRTSVDSGARTIRESSYSRFQAQRKFGISNAIDGKRLKLSQVISEQISKNKDLTMDITTPLIEELGWANHNGKRSIVPERLTKATIIDEYLEKGEHVFAAMEKIFKEKGLEDAYNEFTSGNGYAVSEKLKGMSDHYGKKDFIFAKTIENALESLSNNSADINGADAAVMTKFEANKIDFNTFDIFPEMSKEKLRGTVGNASLDITSIGLNDNDAILKTFSKGLYKGTSTDPMAYDALVNAYHTIGEDQRFKGVWKNLSLEDVEAHRGVNLSILQDKMMADLRVFTNNKRHDDKGFGYKFARTVQDPLKKFNLLAGMEGSEVEKLLRKNYANVDNFVNAKDAAKSSDAIAGLVDNYFMTFSESELEDQIKGLTDKQQNVMRSNYKLAKRDAFERAGELLSATGENTGIDLVMTGNKAGSKLYFNRGSDIRELNMYKYTLTDGIVEAKIGGNHHAVGSAYNTSKMVKNGRNLKSTNYGELNISVTNMVQNTIDQGRSLSTVVSGAIEGKRDILEDLVYTINSKRNGSLREALPRREMKNYNNMIQRATQVDFNGLVSILPEIEDAGIIDSIIERGGISDEYAKMFKESIAKIRGKSGDNKRIRNLDEMLSLDKALYFQLFDEHISDFINPQISFDDDETKAAFKYISNHTKNTAYTSGKKTLDTTPAPHGAARFDKDPRPPVYQYGNTELYNKKEIDKGLRLAKEHAKKVNSKNTVLDHVFNKSNVTTAAGEKYIYNVNGKKTSGLTLKYLQMDSNTLRNSILDNQNKGVADKKFNKIFGTHASEVLTNKVKGMNTYEQQSLMNSRVFDIGFSKTNRQAISAKKELLTTHVKTVKLIKDIANVDKLYPRLINGKIVYTSGVNVTTNQVLGLFGDASTPEVIRAKFDGLFRSRYYKNDEMVDEKQINKFINSLGMNINDKDYSTKVISAINKEFDQKTEVIKKYQTYGQKAFNDTMEKSTVETLAMSVGSLDKDMSNFLKGKDEDLLGKVLSKDYEEEILSKYKDANINGKSFMERYFSEKHGYSDYLTEMYGFEDVSQYASLDVFKHNSSSMAITNGLKNLEIDGHLNDKVLNTLAGEGNWTMNDGKVMFDKIRSLDMAALKEHHPKAYASFNKYDTIENVADETIGHKGYSHVVQVADDSAGTYAGRYTKEAIRSGATDSYKGVKFSKNMNSTLNAMKYDTDSISSTRSRYLELGMEDEFNSAFGHALNKDGSIKESYLGKSILEPVTERGNHLLKVTPGQKLLSEVNGDPRYSHLIKEYGDSASKLSVDRAENGYSYVQGKRSIAFNKNPTKLEYDRLTKELPEHLRFKELDLTSARPGVAEDWMSLDIGGQGNTVTGAVNNPYANNLMIKYGDGKGQTLAIPRMPEAHFDDSVIKSKHIKKLNQLQSTMQEMHGASGTEKAKLQGFVESTANDVRALQKQDMTSKTGLAGEAQTVRMDQAFFGKASGLTYNDNLKSLRDTVKDKSSNTYEKLIKKNDKSLSEAMFEGKSLLQHYSEGKAIDNVFVSEDAFKKMGYFDEDFMKDIFSNMDSDFATKNKFNSLKGMSGSTPLNATQRAEMHTGMKNLLSTHGDSFTAVRYPEIMEGSDTMVRGYLKEDLKDNQIQAIGHTGSKMRLDHDGDSLGIARAKTINDKSTLNYITNTAGADESLIRHTTAINSSMMKKAVTDNWYWDDEVRGRLAKEKKIASLSKLDGKSMIEAVGKDKMIDGKLISSMLDFDTMNTGDYHKLNMSYANEIKMTAANEGNHEKAVEIIKATEGKSVDEYAKAVAYQAYKDEGTAKASNQAIGEINATNSKIKMAFSSLSDATKEDYNYNKTTAYDLFHISEEAAISAKSSIEGLDPDRATRWNSMATDLITGRGDKAELASGMRDWAEEYTVKDMRVNSYWDTSDFFKDKVRGLFQDKDLGTDGFKALMETPENKKKVGSMVINDFINNLESLSNIDHVGNLMEQLAIGQSRNGVVRGIDNKVRVDGVIANHDALNDIIEMQVNSSKDFHNINILEKIEKKTFSSGSGMDGIISSTERNSSKKSISHAILEGAGDFFKGIGSSGIAMGAIGIAAGIMAIGFVGGRPRPADVHAMEEAQDSKTQMNGYSSLADPGIAFGQGGGPNGYVVNINARTDKGREHAVSAIQEAITNGTSSNINVSMNINDNYGNMNDRDLEKAFADVLR